MKDVERAEYDDFPLTTPLLAGFISLAVYVLGTVVFSRFGAWPAATYLLYAIVATLILVPRFVCVHCTYHGRTCYSGSGRIAGLLFAKRDPTLFAVRFRCMGFLAPVFVLPLIAGSILLLLDFSWTRTALVAGFAILVFGCSRIVVLRLGCPHCKQRQECPAHRKK